MLQPYFFALHVVCFLHINPSSWNTGGIFSTVCWKRPQIAHISSRLVITHNNRFSLSAARYRRRCEDALDVQTLWRILGAEIYNSSKNIWPYKYTVYLWEWLHCPARKASLFSDLMWWGLPAGGSGASRHSEASFAAIQATDITNRRCTNGDRTK